MGGYLIDGLLQIRIELIRGVIIPGQCRPFLCYLQVSTRPMPYWTVSVLSDLHTADRCCSE